jgi:hypothetical protein
MGGIGDVFSAVSGVASMFGGDEESGSPSSGSSQSVSGYYASPPLARDTYDQYFGLVRRLFDSLPNVTSYRQVGKPLTPFDSPELYALQQANPDRGVMPIGVTEPFNKYQKTAFTALGEPDYSKEGLAPYMNPYNDMVLNTTLDAINRQADINKSNILDNNSRLNSRALGSGLATQLAQNDANTNRLVAETTANLGYQGYNSAIDLRNQALQQMLGAGSAIQQQNQNALNSTSPVTAYQMTPSYLQASLISPLFGAFPNNSQSTSTQVGSTITDSSRQPTTISRLGGLGTSIFGSNGLSNIFGSIF